MKMPASHWRPIPAASRIALGAGLICAVAVTAAPAMQIIEDPKTSGIITIKDGGKNVLSYRIADQLPAGVDRKYARSNYIHPLWGIDGAVITDDFPADHPHHHGLSWGWPIIKTRGKTTSNWMPGTPPLRHEFVRWIEKSATTSGAVLDLETRWVLENEEVARERTRLDIDPIMNDGRLIRLNITLTATGGPLTLQGSQEQNKGYGGLLFRGAPSFKGARLRTDTGETSGDIIMQPQRWADLSDDKNGIAIFAGFSPEWPGRFMARNSYAGIINPSWPGTDPYTVKEGKTVHFRYGIYLHPADQPTEAIAAKNSHFLRALTRY